MNKLIKYGLVTVSAAALAAALTTADAATVWINPEHPDRTLDPEMQLCRQEAWSKIPTNQSQDHMLIDTIFGTGFCLVQRGWVLVNYVPSKE